MSTLQCPAILLLVPNGAAEILDLAGRRVAHVWADAGSTAAAHSVASRLGVPVTLRDDVADRQTLREIADVHPGETVVVVSAALDEPAEVHVDADGWVRRSWGAAG